jgi:hypothetical protein
VYYEAPKPLVGLTGESRTGDANGIYFRVLGGGGANTYGFQSLAANPSVGTTNTPIEGLEPLKPVDSSGKTVRPPIRPHVPCETQSRPDLHTPSAGPPPKLNVVSGAQAAQFRANGIKLLKQIESGKLPTTKKRTTVASAAPGQVNSAGQGPAR